MRARRVAAGLVAIAAFGLFALLGTAISRYGEPAGLYAWERTLVGHSALIAWWLTWGCYPQWLIPLGIVLVLLALRFADWRGRIAFSLAMLLLCWRGADLFQRIYARPRRLDWVVRHETSFSFPSSHAAISTGFYLLWAVMLLASELPRGPRMAAATALGLLTAAIFWARLALGAHYLSDLAGGALLAVGIVAASWAIVPVEVFGSERFNRAQRHVTR